MATQDVLTLFFSGVTVGVAAIAAVLPWAIRRRQDQPVIQIRAPRDIAEIAKLRDVISRIVLNGRPQDDAMLGGKARSVAIPPALFECARAAVSWQPRTTVPLAPFADYHDAAERLDRLAQSDWQTLDWRTVHQTLIEAAAELRRLAEHTDCPRP